MVSGEREKQREKDINEETKHFVEVLRACLGVKADSIQTGSGSTLTEFLKEFAKTNWDCGYDYAKQVYQKR